MVRVTKQYQVIWLRLNQITWYCLVVRASTRLPGTA